MLFEILDDRETVSVLIFGEDGDGTFGFGLSGLRRFERSLWRVGVGLLIEMADGSDGRRELRSGRLGVGLAGVVAGIVARRWSGRRGSRGGSLLVRSLQEKTIVNLRSLLVRKTQRTDA